MPRYLSGIQPTGLPHLGNFFGAMEQHIAISKGLAEGDSALFFIADLHALTTVHDPAQLKDNVAGVAAMYLALGLDVSSSVFFRQSDIPEVTELAWMLSCVTGMGLLERAVSYKDKVQRGITPSVGLFTYPVLMSADIVAYDSDVVPVGQDQIQHIEFAQDMVGHFNTAFGGGEHLRKPAWRLSKTPKVPGTDGAKMSKSYGNTIGVFSEGKLLKKEVNAIVTDSRTPEEPKDPATVNAYHILELFLNDAERADWQERLRKGGVGYGDLKKEIMARMDARFGSARERHRALKETPAGQREVEDVLQKGAARAREIARVVVARCYDAAGLPNAAARLRMHA